MPFTSSHLHPLEVDEDDNGKFRIERVDCLKTVLLLSGQSSMTANTHTLGTDFLSLHYGNVINHSITGRGQSVLKITAFKLNFRERNNCLKDMW